MAIAPLRPLVFMSNRSEIEGSSAYRKRSSSLSHSGYVRPVVLRIDRDGHVNVNQAERLVALRALDSWLDQGRSTLPSTSPFDATQLPPIRQSEVEFEEDLRGLKAKVTHVSAIYGNVWLNIQKSDLEKIDWSPGKLGRGACRRIRIPHPLRHRFCQRREGTMGNLPQRRQLFLVIPQLG